MITKENKLFKYTIVQIMSFMLVLLSVSIAFHISAKAAEPHISILGTEVTSANASDILGDGHFSYDVESNKLIINGEITIPDQKRITIENTKDLTIAFGTNTKITSEDAWPIRICGSTGVSVTGKNVVIRVEEKVYPAAVSILGSEVTFKDAQINILVVSSNSGIGGGIKVDCSQLTFEGTNMFLECTDTNGNGLGYPILAYDGNTDGYTPYCKPSQVTFELCALTDGNKWSMHTNFGSVLTENDELVSKCTIEDKRTPINDASVTITDQTYTGKALTPVPTVTLNGKTLEKDKDFTVAYSDNINVGSATATITGCGVYTGQITKNFEIKEALKPPTEDNSTPAQTDDNSAPTQTDDNSTSTQPPAVGTALTDAAGIASYSVTASDASAPHVAYTGTTNKKATTITIPETVKISGLTYKVTSIAPNAFKGNKKLKKVTIGANVKEIGKSAFASCPKLITVNCKSKVLKKIGASAFQGDKKLTKITLKSTLLKKGTVGKNAFKGTPNKLVIKVPAKAKKAYKKFFKTKGNKKVTIK